MSDAFTDVAKMKQIKQDIKDHEGQIVELTLKMVVSVRRISRAYCGGLSVSLYR